MKARRKYGGREDKLETVSEVVDGYVQSLPPAVIRSALTERRRRQKSVRSERGGIKAERSALAMILRNEIDTSSVDETLLSAIFGPKRYKLYQVISFEHGA
jgi:hypothetical protein